MGHDVEAGRESVSTKTPIGKFICTQCGHQGDYLVYVKGSLIGEICVWLVCIILASFTFGVTLLIAVGVSLWRHFSKEEGCPKCKGPLIETDSPKGKKLINELEL